MTFGNLGLWGEAGIYSAIVCCIFQILYPYKKRWPILCFAFVGWSFLLLLTAHIFDHFELLNVFLHSHTKKPLMYKIGGVWGSHEGSMLLWCLLLSIFNVAMGKIALDPPIKRTTLILSAVLTIQFLLFLIIGSNPFTYLYVTPQEGQDLNPVLQDFSLTIHPPHLYMGTLGFSLPFIVGLASLLTKSAHPSVLYTLRVSVLFAQFFLTVGIILGAVWAYYELGWGGWWFFDPVENLALAPWLLGLVSMHSLMIAQKQESYRRKAIFQSTWPFLMCLTSLCLVRSGMLNSVHNFAADSKRSLLLLIIVIVWIGITLGVHFFNRKDRLKSAPLYALPLQRHHFMLAGMVAVRSLFVILLAGTVAPLILYLITRGHNHGVSLDLGLDYFTHSFMVFTVPLTLLLVLSTHIKGLVDSLSLQRILFKYMSTSLFVGLGFYFFFEGNALITLFSTLGTLIVVSELSQVQLRLPIHKLAQHLAHGGFGIALSGIILSSILSFEKNLALPLHGQENVGPFTLELKDVQDIKGPNFNAERAIVILSTGKDSHTLLPEERFYWTQGNRHMETSIATLHYLHHVHLVLGDRYKDKNTGHIYYGFRVIYKPYINIMWFGFIMLALGFGVGLLNKIRQRRNTALKD